MTNNPETQNAFTGALKHIADDAPILQAALYGLSMMSKTDLAGFEAVWPGIKAKRRRVIMQQLVEIIELSFEVSFAPIFILGLDDPDPDVQAAAIEGLWEVESAALVLPLIHLMKKGKTPKVRAKAASALGQYMYLGELEEIDDTALMLTEQALLETIRREDEVIEVTRRAVEAIAYSRSEAVNTIIEQAYNHDDELMRISAIFAMGRNYNPKKWGVFVIDELDNPNPAIRFEATRTAGELDLDQAIDQLLHLVDTEENSEILQNAIWSLGQIGGFRAQEKLIALTSSSDEAISVTADEALTELFLFSDLPADLFDFEEGALFDDDLIDFGKSGQDFETYNLN